MLKIGHRGAGGYEPENTIRSFQKAMNLGADSVEFDVRSTKDGELVVFHDATLDRVIGIPVLLKDVPLATLKQFDAGKGEKIPTFLEALTFLKGKARIVVELKERNYLPLIGEILKKTAPWNTGEIIVIAFDADDPVEGGDSSWDDLASLKKDFPQLAIALLFTPRKLLALNLSNLCQKALDINAFAVAPYWPLVTKPLIDLVHSFGLEIFTWVVNSKRRAKSFRKQGIDGIASDFPDRLN